MQNKINTNINNILMKIKVVINLKIVITILVFEFESFSALLV